MINIFHGVKNIVYSHKLVLQQAMLKSSKNRVTQFYVLLPLV